MITSGRSVRIKAAERNQCIGWVWYIQRTRMNHQVSGRRHRLLTVHPPILNLRRLRISRSRWDSDSVPPGTTPPWRTNSPTSSSIGSLALKSDKTPSRSRCWESCWPASTVTVQKPSSRDCGGRDLQSHSSPGCPTVRRNAGRKPFRPSKPIRRDGSANRHLICLAGRIWRIECQFFEPGDCAEPHRTSSRASCSAVVRGRVPHPATQMRGEIRAGTRVRVTVASLAGLDFLVADPTRYLRARAFL